MPQILGEDGRRDGQHRALGMGQAMTAYLGEDHPGQGAAAARAHDQYIARVAGQIDGFRSCASCLVRGWCWKKLVPLLAEHGHSVQAPTLTGLGNAPNSPTRESSCRRTSTMSPACFPMTTCAG